MMKEIEVAIRTWADRLAASSNPEDALRWAQAMSALTTAAMGIDVIERERERRNPPITVNGQQPFAEYSIASVPSIVKDGWPVFVTIAEKRTGGRRLRIYRLDPNCLVPDD